MDKLNIKNEVICVEEAHVMFYCDGCDEEMVVGDKIFRIGLRRLCKQCLMEYALAYFSSSMEVVR